MTNLKKEITKIGKRVELMNVLEAQMLKLENLAITSCDNDFDASYVSVLEVETDRLYEEYHDHAKRCACILERCTHGEIDFRTWLQIVQKRRWDIAGIIAHMGKAA